MPTSFTFLCDISSFSRRLGSKDKQPRKKSNLLRNSLLGVGAIGGTTLGGLYMLKKGKAVSYLSSPTPSTVSSLADTVRKSDEILSKENIVPSFPLANSFSAKKQANSLKVKERLNLIKRYELTADALKHLTNSRHVLNNKSLSTTNRKYYRADRKYYTDWVKDTVDKLRKKKAYYKNNIVLSNF